MARLVVRHSGGREPLSLDTLAAAYAEARQFPQAVATAEEALSLVKSAHETILALRIRSHLDLYRAGRPCRDAPQERSPPADQR
jgi:hypothetical protein